MDLNFDLSQLGVGGGFSVRMGAGGPSSLGAAGRTLDPSRCALSEFNVNGRVVWRGPSQLSGEPINLVVVGLETKSGNVKTGAMVQTFILLDGMPANLAVSQMADFGICGNCPHSRGGWAAESLQQGLEPTEKSAAGRSCYVQMRSVMAVWRATRTDASGMPRIEVFGTPAKEAKPYAPLLLAPTVGDQDPRYLAALAALGQGKLVRCGSYGDPMAVPVHVWRALISRAKSSTGYTRQWKDAADGVFGSGLTPEMALEYRQFCMASVLYPGEYARATALGWRTFRTLRASVLRELTAELRALGPGSLQEGQERARAACTAPNWGFVDVDGTALCVEPLMPGEERLCLAVDPAAAYPVDDIEKLQAKISSRGRASWQLESRRCADCRLCGGLASRGNRNIAIIAHGPGAVNYFQWRESLEAQGMWR